MCVCVCVDVCVWGVVIISYVGGASYSHASSSFKEQMSQADVKIKGKLLKVAIKRPWFKSALFKSDQFTMVGYEC